MAREVQMHPISDSVISVYQEQLTLVLLMLTLVSKSIVYANFSAHNKPSLYKSLLPKIPNNILSSACTTNVQHHPKNSTAPSEIKLLH